MSVNSSPSLTGVMIESSSYQVMGAGLTDRVFIVGHGDGLELNDPYQVLNVKDACVALNLDSTSPLVRTMLEVYYGGGRDIWLVAAAPMSEYQSNITLRDENYYATYANRLVATYALLSDWDLAQIIVLAEGPFYPSLGVDFATPLANHCADAFANTGAIRFGLIGTRTGAPLSPQDVDNMTSDSRLGTFGNNGKYLGVMIGEGTYSFQEMPSVYTGSVIGAAAANLATLDLRLSLIYTPLSNMTSTIGYLTDGEISQLAEAQLNPVSLTTAGVRGTAFQAVMMTDNTMAPSGSDFWSLGTIRIALAILSQLTIIGNRYMGTIGYGQFQQDCKSFMNSLQNNNYLQTYSMNISRDPNSTTGVLVNISITPYLTLRQVSFTATIGPGP